MKRIILNALYLLVVLSFVVVCVTSDTILPKYWSMVPPVLGFFVLGLLWGYHDTTIQKKWWDEMEAKDFWINVDKELCWRQERNGVVSYALLGKIKIEEKEKK